MEYSHTDEPTETTATEAAAEDERDERRTVIAADDTGMLRNEVFITQVELAQGEA